jgi:LacI family transcriptional regulator
VPPCVTPRSGPKVFLDWFREHRPEVVISTSPQPSEWLLQAGEHVPETVGFATVAASDEKISGFDQNFELIGKAAVDKTTAMVQRYDIGIPESPRIMLIEGRWIDGHTLRPKADATPAAPVPRTRSKRRIKATA